MHTQLITSVLLEKSNTVLQWMLEYALNTQPVNWPLYLSPQFLSAQSLIVSQRGRLRFAFGHPYVFTQPGACMWPFRYPEWISVSSSLWLFFAPPHFPINFSSLSIVFSNCHPSHRCIIKLLPARTFEKCSQGGTAWTLTQVKQIHVKLALFWSH